jgi:hypothetical protein
VHLTITMEKAPEVADNKIEPVAMAGESESMHEAGAKNLFTQDEYQLAQLGYKQEFFVAWVCLRIGMLLLD